MRKNRKKERIPLFRRRRARKEEEARRAAAAAAEQPVEKSAGAAENAGKGNAGMDIRFALASADFAVNLLKELYDGSDNILISPVSVETALLMAANGAKGRTLEEFRKLFGGEMTFEELQAAASRYIKNLPSTDRAKFHLANAVFLEENLKTKDEFIAKNRELYGAEVCQIPFNEAAVEAMNTWVEKHTDGMIDRIIEEVDPANLLYLINALSFDGEWQKIYDTASVRPAIFTCENAVNVPVTGLYSTEEFYLTNEACDGFVKPYADGKYSFAALLPKAGTKIGDFLSKFDGKTLLLLPASAKKAEVNAMIPKFTVSFGRMLSAPLMKLGLPTALGTGADFSGISDEAVGIDEVIHKTTLTLDERGTKAGAVTAVMLKALSMPVERPEVILDRPFVYEIIDNSTLLPVFVGVCMKPEA